MQKITKLLGCFLALSLILSSCKKDEKQLATVVIQATAPTNMTDVNFEMIKVKLQNVADASQYEAYFDSTGKASFLVDQGRYNSTASYAGAYNLNGTTGEFTLSVNGINGGNSNVANIQLVASTSSDIIFREFYFCGTKTAAAANYNKDNYFELYNNSDHDVYLDGLCFASIYPYNSNVSGNAWDTNYDLNFIPTGYSTIWQFPGSGMENKLAPGESVVLAQNVKDHRTDAPGSIDLSGAHWAIFNEQYTQQTTPPAGTPILTRLTSSQGTAYLPSVSSPAMVIFYLPMGAEAYVADEATYYQYEPGKSTTKYWHIRSEWIIDGVETMVLSNATKTKRLPSSVDAGYSYVTDGTYANKSVTRKVKETINGREVYQDTNNSTEDFIPDSPLAPRTK